MSLSTPEVVNTTTKKSDLSDTHNRRWAIGFVIVAVVVYLFYTFVLPHLGPSVNTTVREWMPLNSINEALVWVICGC